LRLNHAKDALKRLPGVLLRGSCESLGGNRAALFATSDERLDFIGWTQAAMIEIGQRKLGVDFVGRIVGVGFPVGLGGREIELLFVFESAQRIKVRLARLRL
jgi:hypothetical protein